VGEARAKSAGSSHATVFIVDDDDSVRKSLARLFSASGIRTETFASAEAFMARDSYDGLGVIILDIRMPGVDGMQLHAQLNQRQSNLPVIFFSGHADVPTSVEAMRRGAVHFLTKPVDEDTLLRAVCEAIERHAELLEHAAQQEQLHALVQTLTSRELEILRYVVSGVTNKQIARELDIAEKTVKVHRAHAMQKLKAGSIVDLVRCCDLLQITPLSAAP